MKLRVSGKFDRASAEPVELYDESPTPNVVWEEGYVRNYETLFDTGLIDTSSS